MALTNNMGCMLLLLFFSPYLLANSWYAGGKAGWVHGTHACDSHSLSCDANSLGAGVYAGYMANHWLDLEVGYNYLGEIHADYPALGHTDLTALYTGKVQGLELSVKPHWDINKSLALFAKAGTLAWSADVTGNEVGYQYEASENGWSPMLGTGLEIDISDSLFARIEYQWFYHVGGGSTGGGTVNMLSMGIAYRFGIATSTPVVTTSIQYDTESLLTDNLPHPAAGEWQHTPKPQRPPSFSTEQVIGTEGTHR